MIISMMMMIIINIIIISSSSSSSSSGIIISFYGFVRLLLMQSFHSCFYEPPLWLTIDNV